MILLDLAKKLLITPTANGTLQFFRTAAAGVLSFFLEAGLLYVIVESGVHYLLATPLAFIVAFMFNFHLVRKFVFPKSKKSIASELAGYAWIALVGLGLTELCMYFFTDRLKIYYLVSKFLATAVVMIWSFTARKYWLYRQ
ncbi:MAG: GtrA family protein [Synergistaceae bacterium]|nr:GtrA family protein [Synergistaceae bacterium]